MLSSLFAFLVSIVLLTGVNPNFLTCFSIEVQPLSAQDFIEPTGFHNIPGVKFSSFQLLSNNGNNIHNGFQSPLNGLNMSPLLSHTCFPVCRDFIWGWGHKGALGSEFWFCRCSMNVSLFMRVWLHLKLELLWQIGWVSLLNSHFLLRYIFSTSFKNGSHGFFSDKGLEPNWISSPHQKGYMYISSNNMTVVLPGLTILFLTLYSAFSASVRDATTILSFVGVENMRIWNHFAPKVTFLLVETSCSSISAGKKAKTKHVKMIQQQWSQWVSKLVYTTHKKEVLI